MKVICGLLILTFILVDWFLTGFLLKQKLRGLKEGGVSLKIYLNAFNISCNVVCEWSLVSAKSRRADEVNALHEIRTARDASLATCVLGLGSRDSRKAIPKTPASL